MPFKPLARFSGALLVALALSSCSSSQTRELPGGLKVTPIAVEQSDANDILGLRMWRFNVTLPQPGQRLVCDLEVRQKGKPTQSLGGIDIEPFAQSKDSQETLLIGLHPLNDSWDSSEQIKTLVRIGGTTTSGIKKNPFKNYGLAYGDAEPQPDGSFLLMAGTKGAARWPSPLGNEVTLVLILKFVKD